MSINLHKEILTEEQIEFLPLVKSFFGDFGLVGGTAIALYLGHRRSIDFDLFALREFDNHKIRRKIGNFRKTFQTLRDEDGQYTIVADGIKLTFFYYPFKIKFLQNFDKIIKLPDLLTLAAMKSYTLGRRAKWKDYVDLYFIMKYCYGSGAIVKKAKKIFGKEFNEKLFRAQLSYFQDIDYSEKIIYLKGFKIDDEIIKKGLIDFSLRL